VCADMCAQVRLRLWSFSSDTPGAEQLSSSSDTSTPATTTEPPSSDAPGTELRHSKVRLDIPHAVLCSEMGAHFSPCGRYLAACVACKPATVSSSSSADASSTSRPEGVCWLRTDGVPPSNTAPAAGVGSGSGEGIAGLQPRMMYELRVYSVEEHSFGQVRMMRRFWCLCHHVCVTVLARRWGRFKARFTDVFFELACGSTVSRSQHLQIDLKSAHPSRGNGYAITKTSPVGVIGGVAG